MSVTPHPARPRCRHIHINGTRCSSFQLGSHDLCKQHYFQQQIEVIRKHHVPAIGPMLPLVNFTEDDYDEMVVNISLIVDAVANGNLTRAELRSMTALMRTCGRTLRAMDEIRRLRGQLKIAQLKLACASLPVPSRKRQPASGSGACY